MNTNKRFLRYLLVAPAILLLASCAQPAARIAGEIAGDQHLEPSVGIGPGSTDLKKSPCACLELEMLPPDPEQELFLSNQLL